MPNPTKLVISSKKNLLQKYKDRFSDIEDLLNKLVDADVRRGIDTKIVFIDDQDSCDRVCTEPVRAVSRRNAKTTIDLLFNKLTPAYIMIFGAPDVFPFQELHNPTDDEDANIPSDLPYACDSGYSLNAATYLGPTRVVSRLPDINGKADVEYVRVLVDTIINHKPASLDELSDYFAVSVRAWEASSRTNLTRIFGSSQSLQVSPTAAPPYPATELAHKVHFFNCHGAPLNNHFYGQATMASPIDTIAFSSSELDNQITPGTIVGSECCFGGQLYDLADNDDGGLPICNNYLKNKAIAFLGSSNIAYGPPEGNRLADLMVQYFLKNISRGFSMGRAFLEARQQFLSDGGPHMDPYELKTLAQFNLYGDPSLKPCVDDNDPALASESFENSRLNLFSKGVNLKNTIVAAKKVTIESKNAPSEASANLKSVFEKWGFDGTESESVFELSYKGKLVNEFKKTLAGDGVVRYRVFQKKATNLDKMTIFEILLIKEMGHDLLTSRLYIQKA